MIIAGPPSMIKQNAGRKNLQIFPKKNKEHDSIRKEKNHLIKEALNILKEITLEGTLQDSAATFLIDTGARINYMCATVAKKMKIETSPSSTQYIDLVDGALASILRTTKCKFSFESFPAFKFEDQFTIIDGSLPEIFLGSPFPSKNDGIIHYREKIPRIVDQVLFLDNQHSGEREENPDYLLIESEKATQSVDMKGLCFKRIAQLERNSPKLGTLPEFEMQISIASEVHACKRPYPTPEKLKNAVNNEIERLLEKKLYVKHIASNFLPMPSPF